jgi:(E)-4-hydroxy-3-methylbut-2-enyl-diphosphate synthase
MTTTKTADVEGTLQQIYALYGAGADIVRCTCNDAEAAAGLAHIVPPLAGADRRRHPHQYRMALAALEAGVHGLRLNPGNIRKPEHIKRRRPRRRTGACPSASGSTAGRSTRALYEKYGGRVTPEAMVESGQMELAYFDEVGFDQVKISVKASSVPLMIEAYRQLSEVTDHPLHLGVTEAGPPPGGPDQGHRRHRHAARRGHRRHHPLLAHRRPGGGGPAGRVLLEAMGLRERKNVDLIACPSCGRAEVDVIKVANDAQAAFDDLEIPIQVAVMGCVVNGPGRGARRRPRHRRRAPAGHLFVKGQRGQGRARGRDGRRAGRVGQLTSRRAVPAAVRDMSRLGSDLSALCRRFGPIV